MNRSDHEARLQWCEEMIKKLLAELERRQTQGQANMQAIQSGIRQAPSQ
jgi:hypothetical protein